jgi:hypothetical protein
MNLDAVLLRPPGELVLDLLPQLDFELRAFGIVHCRPP